MRRDLAVSISMTIVGEVLFFGLGLKLGWFVSLALLMPFAIHAIVLASRAEA